MRKFHTWTQLADGRILTQLVECESVLDAYAAAFRLYLRPHAVAVERVNAWGNRLAGRWSKFDTAHPIRTAPIEFSNENTFAVCEEIES